MKQRSVIHAYRTIEWSELVILAALTGLATAVVEGTFLSAGMLPALTTCTPFVAGALAYQRYEYEHVANRVSAALVGAIAGISVQVLAALIVTT